MENKKSDNLKLDEREKFHEKLMESILKNLSDTPLVLKGGSALYLGYGLNRFSEDLDFDSLKKLNLLNKIKSSAPPDIVIDDIHIKKDTDTLSRYIVNYHIQGTDIEDVLKLEVSYRTPVNEEQVFTPKADFEVSKNFYLAHDGIHFIYHVYEIAPYVAGEQDLTVSWDWFLEGNLLKPEFIQQQYYDLTPAPIVE